MRSLFFSICISFFLVQSGCKKLPTISEESPYHIEHPRYVVPTPINFAKQVYIDTDNNQIIIDLNWDLIDSEFLDGIVLERYNKQKQSFEEYFDLKTNLRSFRDTTRLSTVSLEYRLAGYINKSKDERKYSEYQRLKYEQKITDLSFQVINSDSIYINWTHDAFYENAMVNVLRKLNSNDFLNVGSFDLSSNNFYDLVDLKTNDSIEYKAYVSNESDSSSELISDSYTITPLTPPEINYIIEDPGVFSFSIEPAIDYDGFLVDLKSESGNLVGSKNIKKGTNPSILISFPDLDLSSNYDLSVKTYFGNEFSEPTDKEIFRGTFLTYNSFLKLYEVDYVEEFSNGEKLFTIDQRNNLSPKGAHVWEIGDSYSILSKLETSFTLSNFSYIDKENNILYISSYEPSEEDPGTSKEYLSSWDFVNQEKKVFNFIVEFGRHLVVNSNDNLAYITDYNGLQVFDLEADTVLKTIGKVRGQKMYLSPDQERILVVTGTSTFVIVDTSTNEVIYNGSANASFSDCFFDDQYYYIRTVQNRLLKFDQTTNNLESEVNLPTTEDIYALTYIPEENLMAYTTNKKITLYELDSGDIRRESSLSSLFPLNENLDLEIQNRLIYSPALKQLILYNYQRSDIVFLDLADYWAFYE